VQIPRNNRIKVHRQRTTVCSPLPHTLKPHGGTAIAFWLGKILVGDGVPPNVQLLKLTATIQISRIVSINCRPKLDTKATKIAAQRCRVWVARVEFSTFDPTQADNDLESRIHSGSQECRRLRMQIPTKPLKL
jgi:hypothetical protein